MEDDSPSAFTESDVYALLAHERRRLVLRLLDDVSTPIATTELAELIVECEREDPTAEARRVVAVSLHHAHLPRLDDAGVVAYDPDEGAVSPGSNFGTLVGVLTEFDDSFESDDARCRC